MSVAKQSFGTTCRDENGHWQCSSYSLMKEDLASSHCQSVIRFVSTFTAGLTLSPSANRSI